MAQWKRSECPRVGKMRGRFLVDSYTRVVYMNQMPGSANRLLGIVDAIAKFPHQDSRLPRVTWVRHPNEVQTRWMAVCLRGRDLILASKVHCSTGEHNVAVSSKVRLIPGKAGIRMPTGPPTLIN